jgi:hypothetical protein
VSKDGKQKTLVPKDVPRRVFRHKLPTGEAYTIGDGGKHFEISSEKLKESVENQAAWAAQSQSPYLGVSPEMATVYRAARAAKDWYDALERSNIALASSRNREQKKEIKATRDRYATMLAEALATLGHFDEALSVLPMGDKQRRKDYRTLKKALERPDSDTCSTKCQKAFDANPTLVTKDNHHAWQWDPRVNRLRSVIRCSQCGFLNVKDIPTEIVAHREARAKARQLSEGRNPHEAHEALRQAGLTSERVFGVQ